MASTTIPTPDGSYPQQHSDIPYSDHSNLNTLDLWIPRPLPTSTSDPSDHQLWLIFIHGGAWRDPCITSASIRHTQEYLLAHQPATVSRLSAIASLNYRLSPNPAHPTHPSDPADPARNAHHPDHITDVLAAVLHLQRTYGFGARYLLVGHSCGAMLAMQLAMKRYWGAQYEATDALELNVVPPRAVLGVEGLYDLPALVAAHAREPMYRAFVTGAFGGDEEQWNAVSPAHAAFGNEEWEEGRLVVLAQSHEDELVEWEQTALQERRLKEEGWVQGGKERRLEVLELKGTHNQVWEQGAELARAITYTVNELVDML
nr:kynurenine formamidase [Quercus suber]